MVRVRRVQCWGSESIGRSTDAVLSASPEIDGGTQAGLTRPVKRVSANNSIPSVVCGSGEDLWDGAGSAAVVGCAASTRTLDALPSNSPGPLAPRGGQVARPLARTGLGLSCPAASCHPPSLIDGLWVSPAWARSQQNAHSGRGAADTLALRHPACTHLCLTWSRLVVVLMHGLLQASWNFLCARGTSLAELSKASQG